MKKTIAAAVLGVLAVVILAPAALGNNWKHHGEEITQNKQITMTGQVKVQGQLGSVECQVTAQMSLLSGTTTAVMTKFEPDLDEAGSTVTQKCKTGGGLAFCQIHAVQPVALPWQAHNLTNEVRLLPQLTHVSMTGGFCAAKTATITEGTVLSTPNQPKTFSSFTLGGCARLDVNGMEDPCSPVTGTLNVLAPNAATYSLE
ncbi:MAG TPA: hypothetical protein VFY48_05470 [Solirubrobacterales bacterium]|nr:hypothetical protein [Solirubrobacterales bacterium]